MSRAKKIDLFIVVAMVVLSVPLIIAFQVRPLVSTMFFFVLPSVYLFFRRPRPIKRILFGSILFGLVFALPFDFLALYNRAWSEPVEQLVFKYKIFDVLAIDHLIWFFFWVFLILVFYEHFIEHDKSDVVSHNYKYGLLPAILGGGGVLAAFFFNPELLKFDYAYLVLGLFTLIPFLVLVARRPALLFKFLKVSPFFFFLYFIFEITALKLGQWNFPGRYIGSIEIFSLRLPFEEFFFWILMSSTIVLSYYELYVDDQK